MFEILRILLNGVVRFSRFENETTPGDCRAWCQSEWAHLPDDTIMPELRQSYSNMLGPKENPLSTNEPYLHLAVAYDFERKQWYNENNGEPCNMSICRHEYKPFVFPRQPLMQDMYGKELDFSPLAVEIVFSGKSTTHNHNVF